MPYYISYGLYGRGGLNQKLFWNFECLKISFLNFFLKLNFCGILLCVRLLREMLRLWKRITRNIRYTAVSSEVSLMFSVRKYRGVSYKKHFFLYFGFQEFLEFYEFFLWKSLQIVEIVEMFFCFFSKKVIQTKNTFLNIFALWMSCKRFKDIQCLLSSLILLRESRG